jgi:hypothetical protein
MAKPLIPINRHIRVGEDAPSAIQRFSGHFTTWLAAGRFEIVDVGPQTITYERRRFHTWQIVVAVLLFPIGLVALVAEKQIERILVVAHVDGSQSTVVTISGSMASGPGVAEFGGRLDAFDPGISEDAPPAVPSGWYRDPDAPGKLRFWDGSAWTDQRRPA